MELYFFALLPFGLLSAWLHRKENHRLTAGFGFLAALAPVIAKGIGSLISHKQQGSVQKQQQEQARLEAEKADALAKQQWEAQQNSPAAQAARFKNTVALGRLYGAMGGQDKVPPSIAKYYQTMRSMPEYTGQSSYVPQAKKGGTGWDIAGGVADALSYLDTSKLKKSSPMGQTPPIAQTPMASNQSPLASGIGAGLVTNRYNPFDPKLG